MRIGGSIFLIAIGAILAFATSIDPTAIGGMTVEWDTVGVILMVVGAIGLLWALAMVSTLTGARDRDTVVVDDRPVVDDIDRRRVR